MELIDIVKENATFDEMVKAVIDGKAAFRKTWSTGDDLTHDFRWLVLTNSFGVFEKQSENRSAFYRITEEDATANDWIIGLF